MEHPHKAEIPGSVKSAVKGAHLPHKVPDFSATFNGLLCHQGELKSAKKGKIPFSPVTLPNTSMVTQYFDFPGEAGAVRELQYP